MARTRRYIRNYAHEIEPDQLVAYVGQEARRGDGWVKLVGDWIDRGAGDLTPCWPREAVEAAIAEAHRLGARVTAHCFAEDSLRDLVEAGIDCVEHATGLTEDTIPLFAERGVAIVPTLVNIATFPDLAAGGEAKFPDWSAHMRRLYERRYDTVRSAWDAGIPVFVGTDAGGSLPHGLVAAEVTELVTAGIPPLDALSATAWGARDWLGRPGLTEGPRATWWSTRATRAPTSACWRHPAGWWSAARSSPDREKGVDGPLRGPEQRRCAPAPAASSRPRTPSVRPSGGRKRRSGVTWGNGRADQVERLHQNHPLE
ncbi:amidohydrolase family protein [Actinomadura keratinilytica]